MNELDDLALAPVLRALPDPEPPFAADSLTATLDALEAHLRRFVYFQGEHQPVAVALWVAHTHAVEAAEQSPILAVMSAAKRSGKTRLLDVVEPIVARSWRVVRPSESIVFRRIDRDQPTLLLDEVDTIFGAKQEYEGLRALLNAGNRRGTVVSRSVAKGSGFDLVDFRIYCAKALAGIGDLPETVRDRAIIITMTRKAGSDPVERLRARDARRLGQPFHDALQHLLAGLEDLTLPDADLPPELDDRAQDGWEPLLALADLAGPAWSTRARRAAIALSASRDDIEDESLGIVLLRDVRTALGGDNWLTTSQLVERLCAIDLSPWADHFGKPITGRRVAKLLRPFGITPQKDRAANGYSRRQFLDAWSRYLPAQTSTSSRTSTAEHEFTLAVELAEVVEAPATRESEATATVACTAYESHRNDHRREGDGWVCDACQAVAS